MADLILVMEKEHKKQIVERYRNHPELPEILVLNIADEYEFMDKKLVRLINSLAGSIMEEFLA